MARKRFDITPTQAFWAFVILMLACSLYFAISVEMRRAEVAAAEEQTQEAQE